MNSHFNFDETRALEIVRSAVVSKLSHLPSEDADLVEIGALDSMAWVDTLIVIESNTGLRDFGNPWPEDRPKSIRTLTAMIQEAQKLPSIEKAAAMDSAAPHAENEITIAGWAHSLGSVIMNTDQIERDLGLSPHKIRDGAGIQSVCIAADNEGEIDLGQQAAEAAIEMAEVPIEEVAILVGTSTTHLGLPSFAASLHSRLLLPEASGALDVGGACAGLIYSLSVAKSLLCTTPHTVALVVASEVHSRRLMAGRVPGELRGLFGDAACAFVLRKQIGTAPNTNVRLRDFVWGCSGTYASALKARITQNAGLEVEFRGEQLAQAAVAHLDRIIESLEELSARPRREVDYFALHQPNPRVIEILAQRSKIPLERIPSISKTAGNLGSATCGVALCEALSRFRGQGRSPLVFMAAVAPGLLWGGTYCY